MKASAPAPASRLSHDFVPYISARDVNILVVSVQALPSTSQAQEDGVVFEIGQVAARVEDTLSGQPLAAGSLVSIPFKRIADQLIRVRNGFDAWNTLKLVQGSLIVIACRQAAGPGIWTGLAGENIDSRQSPLVAEIRRALEIERTERPEEKAAALHAALRSGGSLIISYALDALGKRSLLGRERGTDIVANALLSSPPTETRLRLAATLTEPYFFDPEQGSSHSNQVAFAAVAQAFLQEREIEPRAGLLDDLARIVLGEFSGKRREDELIRRRLIRSLSPAANQKLIAALSESKKSAGADEQEIVDLLHTWQTAMQGD